MSPTTEKIIMRAPATVPLPVIAPDPTWDALVRPRRPRRRARRVRGRDRWTTLGDYITLVGYLMLAGYLIHLVRVGELVAQSVSYR